MRTVLFILLALPFVLFAQTDWSKSPYASPLSGTESSAEASADDDAVAPSAVRLDNPSFDLSAGTGPLVNQGSEGPVSIDGLDRSGILSWLTNSRVYFVKGDTATFDVVESLVSAIPEARDELSSTKAWAVIGIVSAIVAVTGVTMGVVCKGDDMVSLGLSLAVGGYGFEIFSVRQSNNHYNNAVDIYNAHRDDPSVEW